MPYKRHLSTFFNLNEIHKLDTYCKAHRNINGWCTDRRPSFFHEAEGTGGTGHTRGFESAPTWSLQPTGNKLARDLDGLPSFLCRACSTVCGPGQNGRERTSVHSFQARGPPDLGMIPSGGHRQFHAYVRGGGHVEGSERQGDGPSEVHQPHDTINFGGATWPSKKRREIQCR